MSITNGTPKQIEWASKIAANAAPRIAAVKAKAASLKHPAVRDAALAAIAKVEGNSNASFWIDEVHNSLGGPLVTLIDAVLVNAITDAVYAGANQVNATRAVVRTAIGKLVRAA